MRQENLARLLQALSQGTMTKEELLSGPLKGMASRTLESAISDALKSGQVVNMPGERVEGGTKPKSRYALATSVPEGSHAGLSALESEVIDFLSEQGPSSTDSIKLGIDAVKSSGAYSALRRLEKKGLVKMLGSGRGRGPGMGFWALSDDPSPAPEEMTALTPREQQILDVLARLGEGTYLDIVREGGIDQTVVKLALRTLEADGKVKVVGHRRPFRATKDWPVYQVA